MKPLGIKYRPKTFSEIIGNPQVSDPKFKERLTTRSLIIGNSGSGKTTLAKLIAAHFSGAKSPTRLKDVIELNAAVTGKDDIVDLLATIHNRPMFSDAHIVIIDEAHALTTASVNALLKPLESESEFVIWIFCTDQAHKLPDRVKSRFNKIQLNAPSDEELVEFLSTISEKESLSVTQKQIQRLVRLAGTTNIRETLNSLQDIAGGMNVSEALKKQFNGTDTSSYELLLAALRGDAVVVDVMAVYKFWTDLLVAECIRRFKAKTLQPVPFNYFQNQFSTVISKEDTSELERLIARLNKARTAVILGGVSGEAAWIDSMRLK